jgi:hypothetical protein
VRPLRDRLPALLLVLVMATGNVALCQGWEPTREARMACCAEGASCPMRKAAVDTHTSRRQVSQADADRCCASSEQDEAAPSAAYALSAAVALAPVTLPAIAGAFLWQRVSWPPEPPPPPRSVSRHLLLSVFLL